MATRTNYVTREELQKNNEMLINEFRAMLNELNNSNSKNSKGKGNKGNAKSTKSTTKSEKKTYEEHLTEKFGDKESRTKFVELKKKVMAECSIIAKSEQKYVKKSEYNKVMNNITESLNGRFNKATIKKEFLAIAK